MAVNYQLEIERSFLHKIGIYLQQNGLRDMSVPLNYNQGTVDFQFGNTTYGIVVKEPSQELFYPGINIQFLEETEVGSGRSFSSKKRYLVPIKVSVVKGIEGNTRPQIVKAEILGVQKLILQGLSDGHVDIWDYSLPTPVFTGIRGWYSKTPYKFSDESLAFEGGDIRKCITIFANYLDPSL